MNEPCTALTEEMAEESAVVVRVDGGRAWVMPERKSTCGGCAAKSACGTGVMSKLFGVKQDAFAVTNDFDARVGERIVIGIARSMILRAALTAYMVPLAGVLISAVGAGALGAGDFGAGLAALAGFLAGLVAMGRVSRAGARSALTPVFLRRDPAVAMEGLVQLKGLS